MKTRTKTYTEEDLGAFFLRGKRASGRLKGLAPGEALDDDDDDASDVEMAEYDAGELEEFNKELSGEVFESGGRVWKVLKVSFCSEHHRFIAYYYDARAVNTTMATTAVCEFSTVEEVQTWIESGGDITSESDDDDDDDDDADITSESESEGGITSESDDDDDDDYDAPSWLVAPPKKKAPKDDGMPPKLRPKKPKKAPPKPPPKPTPKPVQKLSRSEIAKAKRSREHLKAKASRASVRELGPGPGTLDDNDIEKYPRRYHNGTAPKDYICRFVSRVQDPQGHSGSDACGAHLCDLVDHLADLYPHHRAAILAAPTWLRDSGHNRLEWTAPKIGAGETDTLVPDHVAIRRDDGSFWVYIVALLPNLDNLAVGGIRRSNIRGVPVYDP